MKPRHRTQLAGFESVSPSFSSTQQQTIEWLTQAHLKAEELVAAGRPGFSSETFLGKIRKAFTQVGCGPGSIRIRHHELRDFTHQDWAEMEIFRPAAGPHGATMTDRTRFFRQAVERVFEVLYPGREGAPDGIVHVTCTGYASPSGPQQLLEKRGWGQRTFVSHAYHMGCYAAIPAIRQAMGFLASLPEGPTRMDLVHTELCSLHLDPARHTPEQMVIQSLFSDGFIKYSASLMRQAANHARNGLEILCLKEEIVADSLDAMTWVSSEWGMAMSLLRDVPARIERALPGYLQRLCGEIGMNFREELPHMIFAIHPGGPKIIDRIQASLELSDFQVAASRQILFDHGNMSSATLPHIWKKLIEDPAVPSDTRIISLAFGPGLTIAGGIFRKL